MSYSGAWIAQFPGNFNWSNAALVTKGMAPYGAVALGEIDEVCERLSARQHEPQAWEEEWCRMGARLEHAGNACEAKGHTMSAGNYYLRAGMYYFTGERFIHPGPRKREVGAKSIELQNKGLVRRYPNLERVEVPFEGKSLPALFMKAANAGRAPTIVVFDGMDNCKEMSVLFNGLEFAARGWNTLAIDGPGQGESLRLRELYARHDYETAGTAAYDYVAARPEVDPSRVVVMGYSFGGYYAARVAAFEKRYAAGVAFAALHWDLAAWQREIRRRVQTDPKNTAQSAFHFRWIMGHIDDADAAIRKAERFSLAQVAPQIEMPFLIVHAEEDQVVPVASAHHLFEAIGSRRKHLKILTAEDGSVYHAQADNRQVGVDYIADWIGDTVVANRSALRAAPDASRLA
jgi:dipeptidyl aminopeptidase/acylaminoacyl peptidase